MKIVVHAGGKVVSLLGRRTPGKSRVTRDASLRAMYDDLASRMALCAQFTLAQAARGSRDSMQHVSVWLDEAYEVSPAAWAMLQQAKTRDEAAGNQHGHQFYGNQHTGGIGGPAKAEHVKHVQHQMVNLKTIKSAKMAVHALLVSGHPFSKEELAEAVGMDPKGKTINDYLTNLKNPKFAGPQGAIKIEKNKDGHFYVAMPDGTPAPAPEVKAPLPDAVDIVSAAQNPDITSAQFAELLDKHKQAMMGAPVVTDPDEHDHELEEELQQLKKADTPAPKQAHLDLMKGAQPGSMLKSKADELYQHHLKAAFDQLEVDAMEDKGNGNDAILAFKNAKAEGMAAWAAAVHGHPFKPAPQQVFKADKQLYEDLHKAAYGTAKSMEQHLATWKTNTAMEKAGNFPPKAAAPAPHAPGFTPTKPMGTFTPAKPKPPEPATATMSEAVPVTPIDYASLRPKGHVDIDHDDIMSGKFAKGIQALKKDLESDSYGAAANKKTVEEKLRQRLADKPNFQALIKRLGLVKTGQGSLESKLISQWASNSGDSRPLSVAMQMAVRDAFSIPDEHIEKVALHSLKQAAGDVDKITADGIHGLNMNMKKLEPHEVKTARAALQEFVQAQHAETQEYLKGKGLDHVYVVRGMDVKIDHQYQDTAAVKLQPASSFSVDWSTSAHGFSSTNSTVIWMKVPREQVLSTYMTGFGCSGEHELTILAHKDHKAWTTQGGYIAGTGMDEAQTLLQGKMMHAVPELGAK